MIKVLWMFGVTFVMCGAAIAGPLAPTLSSTSPTAGETTMLSGTTVVGYVEWMVLSPGDYSSQVFDSLVQDVFGSSVVPDGQYLYAYEVKSVVDNGDALSIKADPANQIVTVGSSDLNMENVGHDPVTFANLAAPGPEEHHVANESELVAQTGIDVNGSTITWNFDGQLDSGEMSETLWFVSTSVPGYRPAQYNSNNANGTGDAASGNVAHTPAPGAMMLGMIGLSAIGWIRRWIA